MLGKQPAGAHTTPVSHTGYLHVPSTFVFTALDSAMKPEFQKYAVERARSAGHARLAAGEAVMVPFNGPLGEFTMKTGHAPMLVRPEELAGILSRAAGRL